VSRLVLSVSELATAVACPRLFYLHRRAGGPTFLFETGRSFAIGRLFHRWLAQVIRKARGRGPLRQALQASRTPEAAGEALRDRLYRQAFFPWLQGAGSDHSPAEVVLLWDSLSEAARFVGELAVAAAANLPLTRVLLGAELALSHRMRVDGQELEIRGTVDALVRDPRHGRLTILEFKTRPDRNPDADLIQVAAYTWLLERARGLRADGALAYFTPRLELSHFPRADLERAVGQQIPAVVRRIGEWLRLDERGAAALPPAADPRLCTICPHHPPCPDRFPLESLPQATGPPRRPAARAGGPSAPGRAVRRRRPEAEPGPERDPLQDQLVEVLASFRSPVEPLGRQVGPSFVRYRLRPAPGVTVAAIKKRDEDLKVQLGLQAVPLVQAGPGYVSVDVGREDREFVPLAPLLDRPEMVARVSGLTIPLGIGVDGRLVTADLADPNTCHFLVGGTPGSGKSEFLTAILCALARRYSPRDLRLVLIDPKQVTFTPFAASSHLQGGVVTDPEGAVEAIAALGDEMDRRYARFRESGVQDLAAYRARGNTDLPRVTLLFDEFGDCMLRDAKTGRALEAAVVRLGQMARAAGIHLVLATQKPVVKVVTGLIKGNLPARVAFRVASRTDSQVILDSDDAAHLLGKGDLIAQWPGTAVRLQSPYVAGADLGLRP
jgi:S-DNA-T family DNA segregation ATPase FtsK/SpoIIIE